MLLRIVAAVVCVVIASCANVQPSQPLSPQVINSGVARTVLVISVAANQFHRMHRGITVFGNENEVVDTRTSGMNESLENWFSLTLVAAGHQVVRIPPQPLLASANALRADSENAIWKLGTWEGWETLAPTLKNLAKASNASTVALIRAGQNGDSVGGLMGFPRGLGLFTQGSRGSTSFAMIDIILVDGSTGKPYDRLPVLSPDGVFKSTPTGSGGLDFVGKSLITYTQNDFDKIIASLAPKTKAAFERIRPSLEAIR
jgi:hypothetical protein